VHYCVDFFLRACANVEVAFASASEVLGCCEANALVGAGDEYKGLFVGHVVCVKICMKRV
jgi:hypothetical protein